MKHWPKMGGTITHVDRDGQLRVGTVTGKNRSARRPVFYVDVYTLAVQDEHVTWMRGRAADTESKRAFVAAVKLVGSAS